MMPENLGWVGMGNAMTYEGKNLQIRFVQMKGDVVKNLVEKSPTRNLFAEASLSGQAPTYQWGRKDPFLRASSMDSGTTSSSDCSGTIISSSQSQGAVSQSIKNPTVFYIATNRSQNQGWSAGGGAYRNLWSSNNSGTGTSATGYSSAPIKTVYDPCPPGFQVPQGNAFTGFSSSSTDGTSFDTIKGYKFKISSSSSEYIYFPAMGYRAHISGDIEQVSARGNTWTAVPVSTSAKSYRFLIKSDSVAPTNEDYRAYGFSVRPVVE